MSTKPVGQSRNTWSQWVVPDDLQHHTIPSSPGVYELAVFRNCQPATLHIPATNDARLLAAASEYHGIVYIGKAICLSERFWRLVQSWCSGASVVRHGSRKNYNQNYRQAKNAFQPGEVRCRFKQLASVDWAGFREKLKAGLKSEAKWQEKLHALWPDSGTLPQGVAKNPPNSANDRLIQSAIATFSEEGSLLKKFERIYRCSPLLNKRPPEGLGNPPTDAELEEWLRKQIEEMDCVPDDEAIRLRAYEKWRGRGCPDRDDWADWFGAELELWENAILED